MIEKIPIKDFKIQIDFKAKYGNAFIADVLSYYLDLSVIQEDIESYKITELETDDTKKTEKILEKKPCQNCKKEKFLSTKLFQDGFIAIDFDFCSYKCLLIYLITELLPDYEIEEKEMEGEYFYTDKDLKVKYDHEEKK